MVIRHGCHFFCDYYSISTLGGGIGLYAICRKSGGIVFREIQLLIKQSPLMVCVSTNRIDFICSSSGLWGHKPWEEAIQMLL